jgi:hypothetical protein
MAKLAAKIMERRGLRIGAGRGPFILPPMMRGTSGIARYGGGMLNNRMDIGQAGDFLGIGKLLKKVISGPIGSVLKVIPGVGQVVSAVGMGASVLAGSGGKKSKTAGPSGQSLGVAQAGLPSLADIQRMLTPTFTNPLSSPGVGVSTAGMIPGHSDIARTLGVGSVSNIPKGYRLNKSRYYIDDPLIPGSEQGREIEPGSRIVKIRHRNPFNPKAASRAMSRLSALHHGMKSLERNLRKLAPPARHRTAAPARKR